MVPTFGLVINIAPSNLLGHGGDIETGHISREGNISNPSCALAQSPSPQPHSGLFLAVKSACIYIHMHIYSPICSPKGSTVGQWVSSPHNLSRFINCSGQTYGKKIISCESLNSYVDGLSLTEWERRLVDVRVNWPEHL